MAEGGRRELPPLHQLQQQVNALTNRLVELERSHAEGGSWSQRISNIAAESNRIGAEVMRNREALNQNRVSLSEQDDRIRQLQLDPPRREGNIDIPHQPIAALQPLQPRVRLPEFSNLPTEDWISFREEYEDAVDILGYTGEMKRRMLKTCIHSKA